MEFFDTTPIGRMTTRFTYDWMAIDMQVPMMNNFAIMQFLYLIVALIFIGLVIPAFFATYPFIIGLCWYIFHQDQASLQLRRIFNKTKSPVTDVYASTLHGLSTIRSFGRQRQVVQGEYDALDFNHAAFNSERFAFE
eukprot:gene7734-2518_t